MRAAPTPSTRSSDAPGSVAPARASMQTSRTARPRRPTRMAFLAMVEEVRAEVKAGAFLTAIYAARRERLGMSYSQFARHVQRYLNGKAGRAAPAKTALATMARAAVQPERRPREPLKLVLAPAAALLDRSEAWDAGPTRRAAAADDDLI